MADTRSIQAIFRAVRHNDAEDVAARLERDPRLLSSTRMTRTTWMTRTLLTQAAWDGHLGVVRLLLEKGADVNRPDPTGKNALHIAAERGHEVLVEFLLRCGGADVWQREFHSLTALMCACRNGRLAVVQGIMRYTEGHGLNERDRDGRTAVWHASSYGHARIVKALLLAGADHNSVSYARQKTNYVLQAHRHPQCAALLKWSKGELQRAYVLHKGRTLHEGTARRQQSPAAPVPAYLSPRVLGGSAIMPSVEVGTGAEKGKWSRGGEDGMSSYFDEVEVEEEEMAAMVRFVVKDLATELYTELRAGFRQGTAGMWSGWWGQEAREGSLAKLGCSKCEKSDRRGSSGV